MSGHDADDTRVWDERYSAAGTATPMWSGQPNGTLVAEVADLPPGTALDVGCGEGADAIWLARRGWQVTAVDPSGVALGRARTAAGEAAVEAAVAVRWVHAGLLTMPGGTGTHDLVSAQYAVLRHDEEATAIHTLLDAVAPGGTLLVVHHDLEHHDLEHHDVEHHDAEHHDLERHPEHHAPGHRSSGHDEPEHEFDPADHVMPADVVAHLDEGWEVEFLGSRPRPGPVPTEARHILDVVLRARRLPRTEA